MTTVNTGSATDRRTGQCLLLLIVVLAVPLFVFGQTTRFTFVNFDDNMNVAQNPWLYPTPNIGHFWRHPYDELYIPIVYTFWAVVSLVAKTTAPVHIPGYQGGVGLSPAPFHIATLVLHLANAAMVFFLLRRLVKSDLGAAAGALLFAVHPLQVESVAWVTATKGTLATALCLAAIHAYLVAGDGPWLKRAGWLILASACYVLALLANPVVVALPIIVLVLDAVLLKRPPVRSLPVLSVWLTAAAWAVLKTQTAQPIPLEARVAAPDRILVASHALGFYLAKFVLPFRLGFDYGRTPAWLVHQPWAAATLLTPVAYFTAVCWFLRRVPVIAAGLGIFAAGLLPTLGLAPFGFEHYSTVADRYVYMAMLGPALMAAWIVGQIRNRLLLVVPAAVLIALSVASAVQAGSWRDSYALANQGLSVNPQSWVACKNLGSAFANDGNAEEAIAAYRESIDLSPDSEKDYLSLGSLYVNAGQAGNAVDALQNAVASDRYDADAHNLLAVAFAMNGQYAQACDEFQAAVSLRPSFEAAYDNLSNIEYRLGRYKDAVDAGNMAVSLDPNDADAHHYLSQALAKVGRANKAVNQPGVAKSLGGGSATRTQATQN